MFVPLKPHLRHQKYKKTACSVGAAVNNSSILIIQTVAMLGHRSTTSRHMPGEATVVATLDVLRAVHMAMNSSCHHEGL
jgi:hypothetical protein